MKKLLWNAAEIRAELYELHNKLRCLQNDHLSGRTHLPGACSTCDANERRMDGVRMAIRHFGGRPEGWA